MDVYGIQIPDKALTNFELLDYAKKLKIPNFRGVFMRDTLPHNPRENESGIVNFNTSKQSGSHWVCYYKKGNERICFDSFGQTSLFELQTYLKKPSERNQQVIQRNTDVVQDPGTKICGHLCLYVLKSLNNGMTFRDILSKLTSGSGIKWSNSLADELHKSVRKNFPKRYVFVRNVDDVWGADLVDMKKLTKENDGYKYILMVIDVFSKFGWAVPIKTKSGDAVKSALENIFIKNKPLKIWADKGTEFYNVQVKALLKKNKIGIYSTENEEKCSVVERWNRTIKSQLYKYFTANGTHRYIDVIQPLIDRYNSTKHRSIGFTPSDARKPSNHQQVFKNLYSKKVKQFLHKKPKFEEGDKVRLAVKKDRFEKAYIINWSDKIYTIKEIKHTNPTTYTVEDDKGKEHKGAFYEQELQKTNVDYFRIEKILKYKKINGKQYALVKWMEYDENTWEPVEEIQKLWM